VLNSQDLVGGRGYQLKSGETVSAGSVGRAGGAASSEVFVKGKAALGLTEEVLNRLVDGPTGSELKLMGSLDQRNVGADLVIISLVVPRPAGDFELGACPAAQVDIWDAVQIVWSSE